MKKETENETVRNNHVGETVGIFLIVELMPYKNKDGHALYKGVCNECGFERIARYQNFKEATQCRHVRIDGNAARTNANWNNERIQKTFSGMKRRCYNANSKDYRWYGAKGIKICDEWMNNPSSFEKWALQNGYQDDLTIDRIDENKDYSPDNCRWVTNPQNAKYKSTTSLISVNGEVHSGRDWSEILGIGINRINTYIRTYGLDNTIEFIKRFMANPALIKTNKKRNIYKLYMESK